ADGGTSGTITMFARAGTDTGGWWGGDGGTDSEAAARVLGPGCSLPVDVTLTPGRIGLIYGSITVQTVDEDVSGDAEQTYWADPNNSEITIIMSGEGDKGAPNIYVSPRALEFGTVWQGDSFSMLVSVLNAGDGDLIIQPPYLDSESCDEGFSIDWSYDDTKLLAADALTGVDVAFTPTSDSGASCTLWIDSNDPDEPAVAIPIQGNVGTDLEECYPTVTLIAPTVGFEHLNGQDLDVIFEVYDCNQPADTLALQIRSGVLNTDDPVLVDTFYAPDESGYVEAKVPRDKLSPGTDTLIVRATDSAGQVTDAAASFLYRASFPPSDDDGDGYGTDGETADDCDDSDIATYPGAIEQYDGLDNDCDGVVDEGTAGSDDDGDGYAEFEGDCDDNDPATFPGAEEIPDYRDNNCNGVVDEGTTLADDDGDGYAESEGDCNDSDPSINPGAVEYCDGVDNDCNGLSDERDGCVDLSSDPLIIGDCQTDKTTISVGEQAHLSAFVYEADGDSVSYAWTPDSKLTSAGIVALDNVGSASPTFTAPAEIPGNKAEETYTFALLVSDPGGHTDYCNVDVRVTVNPVDEYSAEQVAVSTGSCGSSSGSSSGSGSSGTALLIPGLLGLLAFGRRRRRDTDPVD
ncbi:MAG: hypothetical protein GXP62_18490, partial [Oligoflexia bacterium]|nr:hypothetical protein [Oligoflexia bacterium]